MVNWQIKRIVDKARLFLFDKDKKTFSIDEMVTVFQEASSPSTRKYDSSNKGYNKFNGFIQYILLKIYRYIGSDK